jgi:adenylate cyclase
VDPSAPLKKQIRSIESEIEDHAPERLQAMPLLNVVLGLEIPDNDFTKTLEPQYRKSALTALFEDCLRAAAQDEPLLIVIEDMHWIDALSHDLLEELARALNDSRVCFVLAYRPPQLAWLETPRLEAMPNFTKIELHELNQAEAESAIRAKLAQLYPARGGTLPSGLVDELMTRSQGNPFYLEELLNYVRDRGLDPADLNRIELPDSLHTLILSRIDQLSEQEKTTLRVASIVGRLFRAKWLTGYYPELGAFPQVKAALDALESLDITHLDSPEPKLAYLFKHIVTHEVTYESLPFATRAKLHEQLAQYLENAYVESLPLEALAYHYGLSENTEKQCEYLRKAGEAAQRNFANEAALDFYGKLLPLLKNAKEQTEIHLKRGQVYDLMGKWNEAESDYRAALELSKDDAALKANAQFALGKLSSQRGDFDIAVNWLVQAKEAYMALDDTIGLAHVFIEMGIVMYRKGEYTQAQKQLSTGLELASDIDDKADTALALNNLGNLELAHGNTIAARQRYEESLILRRQMDDRKGISASLNNLGIVSRRQGDFPTARMYYEQSLLLDREIGDKQGIASTLNNLGMLIFNQGDYQSARKLHEESLAVRREIGEKRGISNSLGNLGMVAMEQGDFVMARRYYEESLLLDREMDDKSGMAYGLFSLGLVDLAENKPEAREHILNSLHLRRETDEQFYQISSLIGVAGLALHESNPQFAAQVLGSVESALKRLNAVVEADVKFFHAQTLAAVREQLGESAFQSAWEEGQRLTLDNVVELAMKEL